MTSALDADLTGIIDDLAKLAEAPEGAVKIEYMRHDLAKLAAAWAHEDTRDLAEGALQAWAGENALRKRIADHWLERARSTIAAGQSAAAEKGARGASAAPAKRKRHPLIEKIMANRVTVGGAR